MKLIPQAGEATVWRELRTGEGEREGGLEPAEDRATAIAADCARRAAGEVRRYVRANRLDHMWTLTNADAVYDYGEMARRVDGFLRRLREAGIKGPMVLLPEPHPSGHGWHIHLGVRGRRPHASIKRLWGHGIVYVTGPRRRRGAAWRYAKLAAYLSKYLSKSIDAEQLAGCTPRPKGAHRYWRTQAYDPTEVRASFRTLAAAVEWIAETYGDPDVCLPFATGDAYRPEGYWLHFPDEYLEPPPRAP